MNMKLVCSDIFNIWPMMDVLMEAVIMNAK
jgi:hypothetical protein